MITNWNMFNIWNLGLSERLTENEKKAHMFSISIFSYLLHKIGEDGVCSVKVEPSFLVILTRKTNLARVLFFLEPAIPILASTSAFLNFNIPTQSTLTQKNTLTIIFCCINIINETSFFLINFLNIYYNHKVPKSKGIEG